MTQSTPYRDARVLMNVKVPMRDGINLATTVYLPLEEGSYPVVLVRTAYNRVPFSGADFAQRGMAFVVQDVRGRYGSEGEFYPWTSETNDGLDTLEWIANQPWCDGHIGMFGDSYLAGVQLAVAAPGHRCLTALNPRFICLDPWRHAFYFDGVFSLALVYSWLVFEVGARSAEASLMDRFDVGGLLRQLPLLTLDEKAGHGVVQPYRDYVSHWTRDEYWQALDWGKDIAQTKSPMLLTAGWYDYYAGEAFRIYLEAQKQPAEPQTAPRHRVIVGPWMHGINGTSRLGHVDFGPASLQENDSTVRWLECMLTGGTVEEFQQAPIRIFTMGANEWHDEYEWPLARTQFKNYYLHSNGAANSLHGDGRLSAETPQSEQPDRYTYDPEYPVPTFGGNHSVGPYNPGLWEIALAGPYDQRPIERRDDVLVYTSDELTEDTEVTGPIIVKLFAASSAPDTDWVARLCDVLPDGRSINLAEGVIRARFRARDWANPELLEPERVYEYTIDLQAMSNVFLKGHRMRIDITSSSFPLWDRNLNTGESQATGTEYRRAEQTILHDADHPSHIILPLIPRRS
jgi:hypothetical protein